MREIAKVLEEKLHYSCQIWPTFPDSDVKLLSCKATPETPSAVENITLQITESNDPSKAYLFLDLSLRKGDMESALASLQRLNNALKKEFRWAEINDASLHNIIYPEPEVLSSIHLSIVTKKEGDVAEKLKRIFEE